MTDDNINSMNKLEKIVSVIALSVSVPMYLQAQTKEVPDYSTKARSEVPVEYTWKIDDIYPNMEAWKADKEKFKKQLAKVEEMSKDWTSSPEKIVAFFKFYEELDLVGTKLYQYANLQAVMDMGNTQFQGMKGEMQSMFVELGSKMSFMNEDVLKMGQEKFSEYLKKEPALKPYRFTIQAILREKDHVLPADQQTIVSMTGLFAGAPSQASKMLNDLEIPPAEVILTDGKKVVLNMANYQTCRASKVQADRKIVTEAFMKNQKKFENTQAILLTAAMKQHLFSAKVNKFDDCLSARLFGDSIPTTVYTNLISKVRENLSPLHRYYALKKKLLGLDTLNYEDITASSVTAVEQKYTYDEAVKLVIQAMLPLGKEYGDALTMGLTNRWVDIYPNKGKESGAFSSGVYGVHPYVKMNFKGRYDDVSTLAHELGHSMHTFFSSKKQSYLDSGYPTFLAEIASTSNENLLMNYLLKNSNDEMFKLFLIDSYLEQLRATLYHQTMFAEFELNMHKRVEEGKTLTAEWLDKEYLRCVRDYYGHDKNVVRVADHFAVGWSIVPHFYRNFYVFQYSTGIIASLALSEYVTTGTAGYKEKYLGLISSGGSDYPIALLKKAGVDMTTASPYDAAFRQFDRLVGEMEKIVESLKKQGKLK
ncbi:MAG: oligoendopeptidase F [Bacteroidota bacterium]